MKKVKINTIVAVIVFLSLTFGANQAGLCQPGDPGGGDDVPLTGIEWLLAGGALYGARRTYLSFRRRKSGS